MDVHLMRRSELTKKVNDLAIQAAEMSTIIEERQSEVKRLKKQVNALEIGKRTLRCQVQREERERDELRRLLRDNCHRAGSYHNACILCNAIYPDHKDTCEIAGFDKGK